MAEAIFRSESAQEYFRELVESAMHHQQLAAGELTSFYLVNLLAGFVRRDSHVDSDDQPMAIRLAMALQSAPAQQRNGLRRIGDLSLFISGFFAESLNRSVVDLDYYISMGEYAYGSLARSDAALRNVFDELAEKFASFVDVLGEVSERTGLTSNADLLRLYEKWLRTGSRRAGDLLAARGILPNAPVVSRFVQ